MLINCFLIFAMLLVLFATPWRAPKPVTTIRDTYLLIAAGLTQIVVLEVGKPLSGPLFGALLVTLWTLRNQHLPGSWLLLVGVVANGLAMMMHGGAMPLAPSAAQQLNLSMSSEFLLPGSKDVIGQASLWLWLSDSLVVPMPMMTLVISPGDVCIVAALCRWAYVCRCSAQHNTHDCVDAGNAFAGDITVFSA